MNRKQPPLLQRKPSHDNDIQKRVIVIEQLTHFNDRFLNQLLKAMEEGQVVPVIGSQRAKCCKKIAF